MESAKRFAIGVLLPLMLIFGLEMLYRDTLFSASLKDIPLMQANPKLKPLMQNISWAGGMPATILVLAVALNLMSKPAAYYLISGVTFVQYITEALKVYYM